VTFLGYNTNGFAHHRLFDAIELLAEIGYRGVAITIDHAALPPDAADHDRELGRLRRLLDRLRMRSAVETGARYLLNPRRKHEPTLLSEDRRRRVEFYKYAIDCAAALESDCVSIWSGAVRETISPEEAMERLVAGLAETLDYAADRNVVVAFEPEPGMFIDSMARYEELLGRIDAGHFRLTLDVGHAQCQDETPIADVIARWAPRLAHVHIEDMRTGMHEHLMFGEGEIDFPPVLRALDEVGYQGGAYVELSRHSHVAPESARRAFEFLSGLGKTTRK